MSTDRVSSFPLSRRQALIGGIGGLAAATVPGLAFGQAPITLRVGSDSPLDDEHTLALVSFKKEVEAKTSGRVKVTIFPNAQLGGNEAMVNQVRAGTLDGMISDVGVLSQAVPEMDVFSMPFLFKDLPHAMRVARGEVGTGLATKVEKAFGCHVLGWGTDGARNIWNSKRPVIKPADVAGLKMRVQASPVHVKIYECLKALPTPISFSELYGALQTGVVDGADVSVVDMLSVKLYQVTKYLSMTRHQVIVAIVLFSARSMARLSPEDQKIVREAGLAGAKAQADATINREKSAVAELQQKGIVVEESVELKPFADLMGPAYELGVSRFGQPLLEAVQKVA